MEAGASQVAIRTIGPLGLGPRRLAEARLHLGDHRRDGGLRGERGAGAAEANHRRPLEGHVHLPPAARRVDRGVLDLVKGLARRAGEDAVRGLDGVDGPPGPPAARALPAPGTGRRRAAAHGARGSGVDAAPTEDVSAATGGGGRRPAACCEHREEGEDGTKAGRKGSAPSCAGDGPLPLGALDALSIGSACHADARHSRSPVC